MSDKRGFEDVDGHLFPSAQVKFMRSLLEEPNPTIELCVDSFLSTCEVSGAEVAPTLLIHWFHLLRAMVPFTENMLNSAEVRFCVSLADRAGFSLKEILIMSALIGSGQQSHEMAMQSLDSVVALIKAQAKKDGIKIVE